MARGEYLGAKEFNKKARDLFKRVENSLPEMLEIVADDIARKAVQYAKENIENQKNMEDHSEHTAKLTENLRNGETKNVLDESGMLKNSIYVVDRLFSSDSVVVVIGSYMPYAGYHEEGFSTRIPRTNAIKNVPARPFMKPAVERAIKEAFRYGLEERIRKALHANITKKNWKKFFK